MAGPLRSKQGCWTCKLRKKKCDEKRPSCSTCESLAITCYGFGPRPDWMDNGERERAITNSLKEIVKHTSKRRFTTKVPGRPDSAIRIAPKSVTPPPERSSSAESTLQQAATDNSQWSSQLKAQAVKEVSPSLSSSSESQIPRSKPLGSANEAALMMHFLDHIFPAQYPMYNPSTLNGGRGWLLSALFRVEPLFHAALALGHHCRRKMMAAEISQAHRVEALVQQERHLETCLKAVNESAKNLCQGIRMGMAITVAQLVFFAYFTGDERACRVHLEALVKMCHRIYNEQILDNAGLPENPENVPLTEDEHTSAEQNTIFQFLSGTGIWLDIISSTTRGTAPCLLSCHSRTIGPDPQIKLEDIMGCKSWVMFQIGRISALQEKISQAMQQGQFECQSFAQLASSIGEEIRNNIASIALNSLSLSENGTKTTKDKKTEQQEFVTLIFLHMATIYLHLVTHGFQDLQSLETTVSEAMALLEAPEARCLLPALVAPLFFIGSVANLGSQPFFRDVFLSPPLLDPMVEHRGRILPVLGEIWIRRQTAPGFTWDESLELTSDILLL